MDDRAFRKDSEDNRVIPDEKVKYFLDFKPFTLPNAVVAREAEDLVAVWCHVHFPDKVPRTILDAVLYREFLLYASHKDIMAGLRTATDLSTLTSYIKSLYAPKKKCTRPLRLLQPVPELHTL